MVSLPWTTQYIHWPEFTYTNSLSTYPLLLKVMYHTLNPTQLSPLPTYMGNMCIVTLSASWCQCPWEIGSAWSESVGQGEVGGYTWMVQTAWLCLGLWIALGWRTFLLFKQKKNSSLTLYSLQFQCSRLIFLIALPKHPDRILINEWVWLESRMNLGWLIQSCVQVREWKPNRTVSG